MREHVDCGRTERLWLPYQPWGEPMFLRLQSYCIRCGAVKNAGPDRPKKIGYFMNLLSKMKEQSPKKLTQCQTRLIAKELEAIEDFEDRYANTGFAQEMAFIRIVKKYTNFTDKFIESFL